jgi:hypothetical protein
VVLIKHNQSQQYNNFLNRYISSFDRLISLNGVSNAVVVHFYQDNVFNRGKILMKNNLYVYAYLQRSSTEIFYLFTMYEYTVFT